MSVGSKVIIGLTENVVVQGRNRRQRKLVARIDTGATKSSVDKGLAEELALGPIIKNKVFRSAHGRKMRPIVSVNISFCGRTLTSQFSVIDRSHMRYKLLIGQNILKKGFLIDPRKK